MHNIHIGKKYHYYKNTATKNLISQIQRNILLAVTGLIINQILKYNVLITIATIASQTCQHNHKYHTTKINYYNEVESLNFCMQIIILEFNQCKNKIEIK